MKRSIILFVCCACFASCQQQETQQNEAKIHDAAASDMPDVIDTQHQVKMWVDGIPIADYLEPLPDNVTFKVEPDGDSAYMTNGGWTVYKFGPRDYRPKGITWEGAQNVKVQIGDFVITKDTPFEAAKEFFPNSFANQITMGPINEEGEKANIIELTGDKNHFASLRWFRNKPYEISIGYPDEAHNPEAQ